MIIKEDVIREIKFAIDNLNRDYRQLPEDDPNCDVILAELAGINRIYETINRMDNCILWSVYQVYDDPDGYTAFHFLALCETSETAYDVIWKECPNAKIINGTRSAFEDLFIYADDFPQYREHPPFIVEKTIPLYNDHTNDPIELTF